MRPTCPRCQSVEVVPLLIGYPVPATERLAQAGKVALGGCIEWPDRPGWECGRCGLEF